jgi:ubiquinone/menaquinone biosynthesis C-methylase UbiE
MTTTNATYSLGSDHQERERLAYQASLLDQITERFLDEAGLCAGMRVLDVGCGLGDVAMLAAQIVGPRGEVTAIDSDPAMLTAAQERAERRRLRVRFVEADLMSLDLEEAPFDAVLGRLILMHVPDPVAAVRAAAGHVRPGGIVAFQDFTTSATRVHPPLPKTQAALDRISETFERVGADAHGGDNLRTTFLSAGLPEPELRAESLMGGAAQSPVFDMIAGVTQTLAPAMERLGLAQPGEIDPARLREELCQEVGRAAGVVAAPPMVGAWVTTPALR